MKINFKIMKTSVNCGILIGIDVKFFRKPSKSI